MHAYRVAEAAQILGVSDDTIRRWIESGRLPSRTDHGRRVVEGADLARAAEDQAGQDSSDRHSRSSARNQLPGIVTRVVRDTVMAQVEMRCGTFRMVSLMSREAADDLGLEVGVLAVASVKSTNVVLEKP